MLKLDQAGAGAAGATLYAPSAGLSPLVEQIWIRGAADPGDRGWRIVSDASPHIVVVGDAGGVAARLVGARTRWVDTRASRNFTVVVRLRPGALPLLTGEPASGLTDRSVPLSVATPIETDPWSEWREEESRLPYAIAGELHAQLARTFEESGERSWIVRAFDDASAVVQRPTCLRPGNLAEALGVAPRTLRAALAEHTGLSPSTFLRIRRLQRALLIGLEDLRRGWSRAASAAGYFDQPHLVRECRAFLGETPAVFASRR